MTFEELLTGIKMWEGFRVNRYLCPSGVLTVGYGFTASCFANNCVPVSMTKEKADELLESIVSNLSVKVDSRLKSFGYEQSVIDKLLYPLTDFAYNCGMGNLDKLCDYGKRDYDTITEKIVLYNKSNGVVLSGLTKRRQWEQDALKAVRNKSVTNNIDKVYTVKDLQAKVNEIYGQKVLTVDGVFGKNTLKYTMVVLDNLERLLYN